MGIPTQHMASRKSAHKISTKIAQLAAQDLLNSDDDTDITLVAPSHSSDDRDDEEEEEESSEEEEDEDEESDGEVVVPKKRKRSGSVNKSKHLPRAKLSTRSLSIHPKNEEIQIFPRPSITEPVILNSDEPWDTIKAQILVKIDAVLNPATLCLDDYNITFTVPQQVSEPMQLNDETKYSYLVKKALEIKKNPVAKILVEPKKATRTANHTDPDESDSDADKGKKGKKTKVPKPRDILPANVALNMTMGSLRTKWICPTPGGPCGSEHCFSWAAAMLKGKQFGTLTRRQTTTSSTDFLQAERDPHFYNVPQLKDEAATKNAPAAPQVHFNFPPDFANLLRPAAPAPALPNPPITSLDPSTMLVPPPRVPGPELSIEDFCAFYSLDTDICDRFKQIKFKRTNAFKFVEVIELKEMGFMKGEIAELKVAIEEWAQIPTVE
ncbi:hypothetical protein B0H17DRAFT_1201448 [Mycena rosella]|uniref:Uncharacterized protein n=1 Tax=Mycena rosella TaxID=1033263 RepID=A0AAD7DG46_MYCRO|nr:hypothetical protein B0H17DRAFT_1201448 [Mycena rosella]